MKEPRWACPACGSDDVEGLAWVLLNGERVVSWDECTGYWCRHCEQHFNGICQVDDTGRCLMHKQPLERCREDHRLTSQGGP